MLMEGPIYLMLISWYIYLIMIPTEKEILFFRTLQGQNYHFPGQSIQDLKVINHYTEYVLRKSIYLFNI